ncbi:hypothetical protein LTR96_011325 [Exophiala xenobiotica]|nr:hypothetical protein LTR72_011101 [Exophiala xenobiotica]KAK5263258.1 hypothetical protein LTR96_011325 [Exophiala xenobiotica]KAK5284970.1 hypothetical protein LTR14_011337 [Exophiala xenobiotica]KAK5332927.1 hypothetical protein LTR98_010977 [Exophiala xenobiotica]KAK5471426.1 hypothetical protein LTR55_010844 [Exophiala xenobiotica]
MASSITTANETKQSNSAWFGALQSHLAELRKEPFKGVTTDGTVLPGRYQFSDGEVEIEEIVSAAQEFIRELSPAERQLVSCHIDAPEWRDWSTSEDLPTEGGIDLSSLSQQTRESVLKVIELTLSEEGYQNVVTVMRLNGALGHPTDTPAVSKVRFYNFLLFGEPSTTRPWGFAVHGYQLSLNVLLYRTSIVISPWYVSSEPNSSNERTNLFEVEEQLGLQLAQSLTSEQKRQAQTGSRTQDSSTPSGPWNPLEKGLLCGANRDNRIVPYEGLLVISLPSKQRSLVFDIICQYTSGLPMRARQNHLGRVMPFLSQTYFCFSGGQSDAEPFYYRIQGPFILVEFDRYQGGSSGSQEASKAQIQALWRSPNGGDYGIAYKPTVEGLGQYSKWDPGHRS